MSLLLVRSSSRALRTQGRDPTELPLAVESKKIFPTLNDEFGYETEYRQEGHLMFAFTEKWVSSLEALYERQNKLGQAVSKLIPPEEVFKLVPDLPRDIARGMYCADDGQVNPMRLTYGYSLGAKKWKAKILTHTPVKKINVSNGRVVSVDAGDLTVKANWVLNVTGIHAKQISKTVGIDLPIACLIFEILVTEPLPRFLHQVLLCPEKKFGFRQTVSGNCIGGSSVPNNLTEDMSVTREKFKTRAKLWMSMFPKKLGNVSIIRSFAGLYDITPDLIPIIDIFENPKGYMVVAGFSGHGLAIGPAVAKLVADWVATGERHKYLDEFNYARFEGTDIDGWGKQEGLYEFHAWPTKQKTSN
jgi:sarcosine oxidase subunit beta